LRSANPTCAQRLVVLVERLLPCFASTTVTTASSRY
jgi:hypothetical protein